MSAERPRIAQDYEGLRLVKAAISTTPEVFAQVNDLSPTSGCCVHPGVGARAADLPREMLLEEKLEPIFHSDSYGYSAWAICP